MESVSYRRRLMRRTFILAAASLVALLALGAATAGAHGGPGRGGGFTRAGSTSALVTGAAKQLGVTRPALVAAIEKAANARIDEAVEDGDLGDEYADDLKEEAGDNLRLAMELSRTRAVASNLGITTAKLNTGFRAARKALIVAKIEDALADGDITAEQAAELKQRLDAAELPGYKAFGFGRRP